MIQHTFKLGLNLPARADKRVVFPHDGGPNRRVILFISKWKLVHFHFNFCFKVRTQYVYIFMYINTENTHLEGLMIPEMSFNMWRFVLSASFTPKQLKAISARFRAAFGSVGRALSPTKQSASTVKFLNLTSTLATSIPTLHNHKQEQIIRYRK